MEMEDKPERAPVMAYAIAGGGFLAASVLLAVSAGLNWRFGFQLGKTPTDGMIYGAASVAADAFKALSPFFFFAAVRNRSWSQAAAAAVVWVVTMAYSMTSAVGHAALNRLDTASQRTVEATVYKDLRADMKRLEQQLSWIPQHRPAATIAADLDGMKTQRTWALTQGCTDATQKASREFCQSFHKLSAEHASAKEAAAIQAKLDEIAAKIGDTKSGTVMAEADPQASVLSKLTRLDIGTTQIALMLFVVLLIEIGSSFGFYVATSHFPDRPTKKRAPKQAPETDEQAAPEPVAGQHDATVVPFPVRKPEQVSAVSDPVSEPDRVTYPLTKEQARRNLLERIAQYGTIPQQSDLVHAWGVTKGTVSKWLADWEPEIEREKARPFHARAIRKGDRRQAA